MGVGQGKGRNGMKKPIQEQLLLELRRARGDGPERSHFPSSLQLILRVQGLSIPRGHRSKRP